MWLTPDSVVHRWRPILTVVGSALFAHYTYKSVLSHLRTLATRHCPPHGSCSNRSISPARRAHSSKPAAAGLLLCARAGSDHRTTAYRFTDPASHIYYAGTADKPVSQEFHTGGFSIGMFTKSCVSLAVVPCDASHPCVGRWATKIDCISTAGDFSTGFQPISCFAACFCSIFAFSLKSVYFYVHRTSIMRDRWKRFAFRTNQRSYFFFHRVTQNREIRQRDSQIPRWGWTVFTFNDGAVANFETSRHFVRRRVINSK